LQELENGHREVVSSQLSAVSGNSNLGLRRTIGGVSITDN
jgi:hypothetical protein